MAWAALIPVAMQLLKGEEKQQPQGPAMPPPPSMGEMYQQGLQGLQAPRNFALPTSDSSIAGPVGGKRGY